MIFPLSLYVMCYAEAAIHIKKDLLLCHAIFCKWHRRWDGRKNYNIWYRERDKKCHFARESPFEWFFMTIFVFVVGHKPTLSSLWLSKTPLRTTTTDERLELWLLLYCEKDLANSINFCIIGKDWPKLKTQRMECFVRLTFI